MSHDADEQRILAWLSSPTREQTSQPAAAPEPVTGSAAGTAAAPPAAPAPAPAYDAEARQALRAQIRRLHTSTLTRRIRELSPRLSPSRAAEHAAAWGGILADPAHLDDWVTAGLRVGDHALAARCIHREITPARLRPLLRNPELTARLRSGADPATLLAE